MDLWAQLNTRLTDIEDIRQDQEQNFNYTFQYKLLSKSRCEIFQLESNKPGNISSMARKPLLYLIHPHYKQITYHNHMKCILCSQFLYKTKLITHSTHSTFIQNKWRDAKPFSKTPSYHHQSSNTCLQGHTRERPIGEHKCSHSHVFIGCYNLPSCSMIEGNRPTSTSQANS